MGWLLARADSGLRVRVQACLPEPFPESLVFIPELPDSFDLLIQLPYSFLFFLLGPALLLLFNDALVPLGPCSGFEPSEKETQLCHTSEDDVVVSC